MQKIFGYIETDKPVPGFVPVVQAKSEAHAEMLEHKLRISLPVGEIWFEVLDVDENEYRERRGFAAKPLKKGQTFDQAADVSRHMGYTNNDFGIRAASARRSRKTEFKMCGITFAICRE
jgi:hypothetical protein